MNILPDRLYHIYNRGNNKQQIFFTTENYLFFLRKIRKEIRPYCDILSYNLMPNHFHFLIKSPSNEEFCEKFTNKFRVMLSSYTRAIQKQERMVGSLFQQNSKSMELLDDNQLFTCFQYIHQNPLKADLIKKLEDWEFSSYRDYAGFRDGTLCNREMTYSLIDLPHDFELFKELSYRVINNEKSLKNIGY